MGKHEHTTKAFELAMSIVRQQSEYHHNQSQQHVSVAYGELLPVFARIYELDAELAKAREELAALRSTLATTDEQVTRFVVERNALRDQLAAATPEAVLARAEELIRGVMKYVPLSLTINTDENGGIGSVFDGEQGEVYSWTPTLSSCVKNLEEQLAAACGKVEGGT